MPWDSLYLGSIYSILSRYYSQDPPATYSSYVPRIRYTGQIPEFPLGSSQIMVVSRYFMMLGFANESQVENPGFVIGNSCDH